MATTTFNLQDTGTFANAPAMAPLQPRLTGFLRRMGAAFMAAQQRRVDREIAALIHRNGGQFSDEVERRIMQLHRTR